MEPLARVLVFIKRRAVKPAQPVLIGREMPRHPVEQDADALLMRMGWGSLMGRPCMNMPIRVRGSIRTGTP